MLEDVGWNSAVCCTKKPQTPGALRSHGKCGDQIVEQHCKSIPTTFALMLHEKTFHHLCSKDPFSSNT
jgi:hypothetical protein